MTKEEYKEKTAQLYKEYQSKQRELDVEFALSNNEVKIGDVVADNCCMIIVEKIRVDTAWAGRLPCAYFEGTRITKSSFLISRVREQQFTMLKNILKQKIYDTRN